MVVHLGLDGAMWIPVCMSASIAFDRAYASRSAFARLATTDAGPVSNPLAAVVRTVESDAVSAQSREAAASGFHVEVKR